MLIVEDYRKINQLIAMFSKTEGYEVTQVYDAESALIAMNKDKFDVIVLDLMLPGYQGESLIKDVRKISDVYIIVVSAKIDVKNRIDVISLGADDYLTKPFSIEELMAKLRNVAKRLVVNNPNILSFNQQHLKIHQMSREVYVNQKRAILTPYEYDVLIHLATHPHVVFSRNMIIEQCFSNSDAYDRVIDVFIKNIRKNLDDPHCNITYIKTHYGIGYQFVGEKDEEY